MVMLGVVVMFNTGIGEGGAIWIAASLCLGWVTRTPWLAFLPLLAAPIAVPFGYPEEWMGRTALPLWFVLLWAAPFQAALVIAGWGGRRLYEGVMSRCRQS